MFKGASQYFKLGEHFLTENNLEFIESRLKLFPLENISYGDAGELNSCRVGRLIEDQPGCYPEILNSNLSPEILSLFTTEKATSFFNKFIANPSEKITLRRCQFNLLDQGSFVGRHLDIDSNPDYEIACVLQLGSDFEGGEFVVYPDINSKEADAQVICPEYGSLTISFCTKQHEVKKVINGVRTSFVLFASSYSGKNKRATVST